MEALKSNIFDIALIFEGGGMRAAYTAGVANTLLEHGLYFDNVYGVSAGSSHSVDYLSRDAARTREAFVDLADDPQFAGIGPFLRHRGYFNAYHDYLDIALPDGGLPFDFATFAANPAHVCIESFARDTGETIYWTKDDMPTLEDLMLRVRASSTIPFFMPSPVVDGVHCYDGGLGEGAGILLPKAKADGFEKFFVVRTRRADYRKVPPSRSGLVRTWYHRHPRVADALLDRWQRYNAVLDELEELRRQGRALIVFAEDIDVESMERSRERLQKNYDRGYTQAQREVNGWMDFLNVKC